MKYFCNATVFGFRRIFAAIYTTNAIESLNEELR
jgi:transposase-like protein